MGIELIEHEVSSLFVLSSILKLRAAAIYVVEENLTDGTALDETELKADSIFAMKSRRELGCG